MIHRESSGLVTLRGLTTQARARFHVQFGGNVALSTGATVAPVQFAIAVGGEPILSTQMIVTPAAVNEYFNVYRSMFLDVPRGCCSQVSVENLTGGSILVQNANLTIERVA